MQGVTSGGAVGIFSGGSTSGSMSTVSKEDNLVLSSEDSSCPDESLSELDLGLGLSLSRSGANSHATPTAAYARILTAKDFSTSVSSASASASASSSSSSSSRGGNATSGTKRTADSVVATNGPSQVVGWPPLGVYRMNSFNSQAKSEVFNSMVEKSKINNTVVRKSADSGSDNNDIIAKEKGHLRSSSFVKVNMDGIPIGRKVDLSAHSCYENLARTLEDMFNEPTTVITCKVLTSLTVGSNGEDHGIIVGADGKSKLLDGSSKFVLTYEDKEGDWMLVGDVPWWMFLSSVRRLRIMRTSEANGLAPRLEEKNSRLKSKPM